MGDVHPQIWGIYGAAWSLANHRSSFNQTLCHHYWIHHFLTSSMNSSKINDEKGDDLHVEDIQEVQLSNRIDLDTIEQTRTGAYAWMITITAAIGGSLFGYDTGIIRYVCIELVLLCDGVN